MTQVNMLALLAYKPEQAVKARKTNTEALPHKLINKNQMRAKVADWDQLRKIKLQQP